MQLGLGWRRARRAIASMVAAAVLAAAALVGMPSAADAAPKKKDAGQVLVVDHYMTRVKRGNSWS